jgi:hypothetical protein
MNSVASRTLTRLAALGTLSRNAGEGGPSPQGLVGEGGIEPADGARTAFA